MIIELDVVVQVAQADALGARVPQEARNRHDEILWIFEPQGLQTTGRMDLAGAAGGAPPTHRLHTAG